MTPLLPLPTVREVNLSVFEQFDFKELREAYDIANGIHSGIPICCVLSFAHGRRGEQARAEKRSRADDAYYAKHPANYVQCRDCFRKRRHVKALRNGHLMLELGEDLTVKRRRLRQTRSPSRKGEEEEAP